MKPAEGQLRQSLGQCSGNCMAWEQGGIVVPMLSPQLLLLALWEWAVQDLVVLQFSGS